MVQKPGSGVSHAECGEWCSGFTSSKDLGKKLRLVNCRMFWGEKFDILFVWDIFPVRSVSDQDRNFFCCLWTVDVASNESVARLELDRRVLLEHIRE